MRFIITLAVVFNLAVVGMVLYNLSRANVDSTLERARVALLPDPRAIPAFELIDHNGSPVTNGLFVGRWSLVFFGFTHCPDICPTTMATLAQVAQRLSRDAPDAAASFQGVMVSVDPERDVAPVLRDYVTAFSPGFVGLTGDVDQVKSLAGSVHVAFAKGEQSTDTDYLVDHSAHIVIINPDGGHHGYIKLPHDPDAIANAVRALHLM